ncbi:hypothetical protein ACET3Z_031023 [Daucus carota]
MKEYVHPPKDETYIKNIIEESYNSRKSAGSYIYTGVPNSQNESDVTGGQNISTVADSHNIGRGTKMKNLDHLSPETPPLRWPTNANPLSPLTPLSPNINSNRIASLNRVNQSCKPPVSPVNGQKRKGHGMQSKLCKENIPPAEGKGSESVTIQMAGDSRTSPLSRSSFPNRRCDPIPFSLEQARPKQKGVLKENRAPTNLKRKELVTPCSAVITPSTEKRLCKNRITSHSPSVYYNRESTICGKSMSAGKSATLKQTKDKGKMVCGIETNGKELNDYSEMDCDSSDVFSDEGFVPDMDIESEIPPRKLNFSNHEAEHSFSDHFNDLGFSHVKGSYSNQSDGDSDDEFIGDFNTEMVDDEEPVVNDFYVMDMDDVEDSLEVPAIKIKELRALDEKFIQKKVSCQVTLKKFDEKMNWFSPYCIKCEKDLELVDGNYKCCGRNYPYPDKRFRLYGLCCDDSGTVPIVWPDEEVCRLIGKTVYDVDADETEGEVQSKIPDILRGLEKKAYRIDIVLTEENLKEGSNVYQASHISTPLEITDNHDPTMKMAATKEHTEITNDMSKAPISNFNSPATEKSTNKSRSRMPTEMMEAGITSADFKELAVTKDTIDIGNDIKQPPITNIDTPSTEKSAIVKKNVAVPKNHSEITNVSHCSLMKLIAFHMNSWFSQMPSQQDMNNAPLSTINNHESKKTTNKNRLRMPTEVVQPPVKKANLKSVKLEKVNAIFQISHTQTN